MADLSTLDRTQPPDSESAGSGASRIREERDSILTSFAIEHALAGAHAFLRGNQAARPAAGTAGRIYLNTTDKRVERDDGTTWNILNAVQLYSAYTAAASALPAASVFVTIQTVAVDVPSGGRVFILGQFQASNPSSSSQMNLGYRIQYNGAFTGLSPDAQHTITVPAVGVGTCVLCAVVMVPASAGTQTITLDAASSISSTNAIQRLLVVAIA